MRILPGVIVLIVAVAVAAVGRARASGGVLGRLEAYGRPMSDWAGVSLLGLGAGLAAMVAGLPGLAWLLMAAVLVESFMTLRAVPPGRRRG